MSIIFYPGRIYKRGDKVPAIDRVMARRLPKIVRGSANVASNVLSEVISCDTDWMVDSISFDINSSVSKDFGYAIKNGVKIVKNYNDALWFHGSTTLPQRIVLSEGFYTGTELASELQTKLDANTAYNAASITFTVAYDNVTGLFDISPLGSNLKYLQINIACPRGNDMDSIAGHLFGLTATNTFSSNVISDTIVAGLNDEVNIVYNIDSNATNYYSDTVRTLSMDQALHLKSNNSSSVIDWQVVYEELV